MKRTIAIALCMFVTGLGLNYIPFDIIWNYLINQSPDEFGSTAFVQFWVRIVIVGILLMLLSVAIKSASFNNFCMFLFIACFIAGIGLSWLREHAYNELHSISKVEVRYCDGCKLIESLPELEQLIDKMKGN